MVLESVSSKQEKSTFTITTGVNRPKHIFVCLQRANKAANQRQNPHIFDTFKINAANETCYLQSGDWKLETVHITQSKNTRVIIQPEYIEM